MKICDQELLARLRAFGSKVRGSAAVVDDPADQGSDDALCLLGLSAPDLTPKVRSALGQLIGEVAELRHELLTTRRRLMELERLADEDSLAPISNRRAFLRHLARTITYVGRYGAACNLLYFDVNGLKTINDTHGHAAGDAALIHVADTLRGNTRTSDMVGRLGGDEFAVLMPGVTSETMHRRFDPIKHDLDRMVERHGWRISFSIGVVACESATPHARDALTLADRMMYDAKGAGRDAIRYAVFRDGRLITGNEQSAAA
jgi:diguanylate cyclase (GGDEF)-like protein